MHEEMRPRCRRKGICRTAATCLPSCRRRQQCSRASDNGPQVVCCPVLSPWRKDPWASIWPPGQLEGGKHLSGQRIQQERKPAKEAIGQRPRHGCCLSSFRVSKGLHSRMLTTQGYSADA